MRREKKVVLEDTFYIAVTKSRGRRCLVVCFVLFDSCQKSISSSGGVRHSITCQVMPCSSTHAMSFLEWCEVSVLYDLMLCPLSRPWPLCHCCQRADIVAAFYYPWCPEQQPPHLSRLLFWEPDSPWLVLSRICLRQHQTGWKQPAFSMTKGICEGRPLWLLTCQKRA